MVLGRVIHRSKSHAGINYAQFSSALKARRLNCIPPSLPTHCPSRCLAGPPAQPGAGVSLRASPCSTHAVPASWRASAVHPGGLSSHLQLPASHQQCLPVSARQAAGFTPWRPWRADLHPHVPPQVQCNSPQCHYLHSSTGAASWVRSPVHANHFSSSSAARSDNSNIAHDTNSSSATGSSSSSSSSNPTLGSRSTGSGGSSSSSSVRGPYREGYGGKVSVPSIEVLQQPLLTTQAAVRARAYHIGWHIHIGKLAKRAERLRCRVQAGKDYVLIWLPLPGQPLLQELSLPWRPSPAPGSGRYTPVAPGQRLAVQAEQVLTQQQQQQPGVVMRQLQQMNGAAAHLDDIAAAAVDTASGSGTATGSTFTGRLTDEEPHLALLAAYRYGSVVFLHTPEQSVETDLQQLRQLLQPAMLYKGRQQEQADMAAHLKRQRESSWFEKSLQGLVKQGVLGRARRPMLPKRHRHPWQSKADAALPRQHLQLYYYRDYKRQWWLEWLHRLMLQGQQLQQRAGQMKGDLMQPLMRRAAAGAGGGGGTPGGPTAAAGADLDLPGGRSNSSSNPAISVGSSLKLTPDLEEYLLLVDPEAEVAVSADKDCLHLRVLDVGNTRVVTSLLAQSVALDWYNRSVGASLENFQHWKAKGRGRSSSSISGSGNSGVWGLGASLWEKRHDGVLQQVLAGAALVSSEARSTLEMVEPAWQYDVYHDTWNVMAQEFDLDRRLTTLMTKLARLEKEARFDVKVRHGRRYHSLSRAVEVLLMTSVAMALWEAGTAALDYLADASLQQP